MSETSLRIMSSCGSASPHLIANQVRPSFCAPHLNGVQVVGGSNPPAPTIDPLHQDRQLPTKVLIRFPPKGYCNHACIPPLSSFLQLGPNLALGVGGGGGGGGGAKGLRAPLTQRAIRISRYSRLILVSSRTTHRSREVMR